MFELEFQSVKMEETIVKGSLFGMIALLKYYELLHHTIVSNLFP